MKKPNYRAHLTARQLLTNVKDQTRIVFKTELTTLPTRTIVFASKNSQYKTGYALSNFLFPPL